MRAIKGILFDKDGTLLDFNRTWLAPYRRAAEYLHARFGERADPDELLARGGFIAESQTWQPDSPLASGSNREIIDFWSEAMGQSIERADRDALESIFTLSAEQYAPAVDDMAALFAALRRDDMVLGLATMDNESNARLMLCALGVEALFDFVCGADSGHGVKPDAGMALAFCRACRLRSGEVMVVGDSPKDLNMGKNAGVALTVGVLTGAHTAADLACADRVLNSIAEVPAVVGGGTEKNPPREEPYPPLTSSELVRDDSVPSGTD